MAKGDIRLHPTKGINPHLTFCPNCGKEDGIALVGADDKIYECRTCGLNHIGKPEKDQCQRCGHLGLKYTRELAEHEKIPGGLCEECESNFKAQEEIIAAGGIYFRCTDCKATGAIRAENEICADVRQQLNIPAPEPCMVEFSNINCPACGPDAIKET